MNEPTKNPVDEAAENAFRATNRSDLVNVILIALYGSMYTARMAFWALLTGAGAFVLAAALIGFSAWLFGASDPRRTAITFSMYIAGVIALVDFLIRLNALIRYWKRQIRLERVRRRASV